MKVLLPVTGPVTLNTPPALLVTGALMAPPLAFTVPVFVRPVLNSVPAVWV